jgi:uncharacterized membrane protein
MLNVKLKLVAILFLVFAGFCVQGQAPSGQDNTVTGDSTQIKLDEYKKMYESDDIDSDEYNKLKAGLLNTKPQPQTPGTANTQTTDSTQIKLDQLKKVYDTGAMNDEDYNKARAKILGLPQPEIKQPEVKSEVFLSKTDTMSLKALQDRAKSKVIGGSVILSLGAGFIIGDILLATVSRKLNPKDSTYSDELTTRRGSEAALGVLGGVASIGGAVFLALGLKDRAIYRRRNKALTMNFTGKEIEIAFVF